MASSSRALEVRIFERLCMLNQRFPRRMDVQSFRKLNVGWMGEDLTFPPLIRFTARSPLMAAQQPHGLIPFAPFNVKCQTLTFATDLDLEKVSARAFNSPIAASKHLKCEGDLYILLVHPSTHNNGKSR